MSECAFWEQRKSKVCTLTSHHAASCREVNTASRRNLAPHTSRLTPQASLMAADSDNHVLCTRNISSKTAFHSTYLVRWNVIINIDLRDEITRTSA